MRETLSQDPLGLRSLSREALAGGLGERRGVKSFPHRALRNHCKNNLYLGQSVKFKAAENGLGPPWDLL